MITSPAFSGKSYAVLGLARSGRATVDALVASGAQVTAWDEKEEARAAVADKAAIGDPLKIDLAGFDGVVVSPGVPLNTHPIAQRARDAGVPLIGDIELFAQARPSLPPHKVVGITGTNGKSTTTALVHHILKTAGVPTTMGGNIGLPILAQDPLPEGGVYVLELSSYQIDLTQSLDCDVAVLLNITPDHLDRYQSFEAYAASKARLFEMQSTGVAVITDDDEPTRNILSSLGSRLPRASWFPDPVGGQEQIIIWRPELGRVARPLVIYGQSPYGQEAWPSLAGPHNAQNAATAIATCRLLGLTSNEIASHLRSYPGLPHRMERVREKDGILFVNDSKATNPDSTAPALAAYPHVHWIVGGLAKTKDLGPCEDQLGHVRAAYTIGEAGPMFAALLRGRVPVDECGVLDKAVSRAADAAVAGDVVLLSPACASFDQFRDYEARGEAFRAAVEAL
jgi:UDP-N-acetylmuramoylalanine--D-glutamate ligase